MNFLRQFLVRPPAHRAGIRVPYRGAAAACALSVLVHVGLVFVLTLVVVAGPARQEFLVVVGATTLPDEPLAIVEELFASEFNVETVDPASQLDAAAFNGVALDAVDVAAGDLDVSESPVIEPTIDLQAEIDLAAGENFVENVMIRGVAGVGVGQASGAVDRITQEIVLSLEERPTLVVWFFDQSGSLEGQRAEIVERFDRVYDELGVIEARGEAAFRNHQDKPLLTSVVAFGERHTFLTPQPTDDLEAIKAAVAGIETDPSGVERTFSAVRGAAERFRVFRTREPRRNVLFVLFTDEVGDDEAELDGTVTLCRRYEIPVYCVGVPAPFGRSEVLVRYVDPDPRFDQSPQWLPVRQGPESFLPELVKIGSAERDEAMDSGFGPYGLTRLCYETGGIFFAVQPPERPQRGGTGASPARFSRSFDPQIMANYRPDYVPIREYQRLVAQNKARAALVQAAQMSWLAPMEQPQLVFPKTSEAELVNQMTRAQRAAAVLEPKVQQLYDVLKQGESDRARLVQPRWQASYDLSLGLVQAIKVRTETYNAVLAQAKSGMAFSKPDSDTWVLTPADEINVGSSWEKLAAAARENLQRVVREHPQTPWAVLAEAELAQPLGWAWKETHTGVNEQRAANNARRQQPRDDRAKSAPPPPKRPPPKL